MAVHAALAPVARERTAPLTDDADKNSASRSLVVRGFVGFFFLLLLIK